MFIFLQLSRSVWPQDIFFIIIVYSQFFCDINMIFFFFPFLPLIFLDYNLWTWTAEQTKNRKTAIRLTAETRVFYQTSSTKRLLPNVPLHYLWRFRRVSFLLWISLDFECCEGKLTTGTREDSMLNGAMKSNNFEIKQNCFPRRIHTSQSYGEEHLNRCFQKMEVKIKKKRMNVKGFFRYLKAFY